MDSQKQYIAQSTVELDQIRLRIEMLQLEITTLKAKAQEVATRQLANAPTENLGELANVMYWWYDGLVNSSTVTQHFSIHTGRIKGSVIQPAAVTVMCSGCGIEHDTIVASRTQFKDLQNNKAYKQIQIPGNHTTYVNLDLCDACVEKRKTSHVESEKHWQAKQVEDQKRVEELRTMPYQEYLKTEHWKSMRLRMLKRANHKCQICNSGNRQLHVHHRTYANRGNEQYGDLIVLCHICHETFHTYGELSS